MAERFQAAGLCWSVLLCLVLAVLKLTVLLQLLFWSEVVDSGNRRTHRGQ